MRLMNFATMTLLEVQPERPGVAHYDAMFAKRMSMAGILPDDRIAIAVSGGPDSMALCALAERWKRSKQCQTTGRTSHQDTLLGLVVDHGLRHNSASEAAFVQKWVSDLGIRCQILQCRWPDGIPAQGRLQEAARNARYSLLEDTCEMNGIPILLTAHHGDDQVELFIIRLSRKSGISGLAGMAFVSSLTPRSGVSNSVQNGVLLIRPLLDFKKQDLIMICQEAKQNWVEDPTNVNPIFTRSRVRDAIQKMNGDFKAEVANLIAACRETREVLDRARDSMLSEALFVSHEFGFATLDLEKFTASSADPAVQFRVVVAILQFVGQKEKPPRGRVVQALLERLCRGKLQAAFTVGGCFVRGAPGSKGCSALFCWSPDCAQPALPTPYSFPINSVSVKSDLFSKASERKAKILLDLSPPLGSELNLDFPLDPREAPDTILERARTLGWVSDGTAASLERLRSEISKDMEKSSDGVVATRELPQPPELCCGESGYFWDRFFVSLVKEEVSQLVDPSILAGGQEHCGSTFCDPRLWISRASPVQLRPFEEKDWLHLSALAKCKIGTQVEPSGQVDTRFKRIQVRPCHCQAHQLGVGEQGMVCNSFAVLKARAAVRILKHLPQAVRRGLPALLSAQGVLIAVPSVGYQMCPLVSAAAKYRPRFPLGGGTASWK